MQRLMIAMLLGCLPACDRPAADTLPAADTVPAVTGEVPLSPADSANGGTRGLGALFDPSVIEVGDTVAGLTVVKTDLQRALALPDSPYVGNVQFRGPIELTGTLMKHPDPEHIVVCFEADTITALRIPRMYADERRAWFCFTNYDEAVKQVAGIGPAETFDITIDDFLTHYSFSDGYNTARLLRVTRKRE